jgi:uncharacterized peroxidase-related enzyme
MARIKVIAHVEAEGRLKAIYDEIIVKRKKLAEVHKIQSLRPESIVKHMDLYMEIMFSKSTLSRTEREMMAVVVSAANKCTYCQAHHGEALNHFWKNEAKVKMLKSDFHSIHLSLRERVLCEFAHLLTANPGVHEKHDLTLELRSAGIDDAGILDATLVVSYFNFVNRMVLALGVELEDDSGKGYDFD